MRLDTLLQDNPAYEDALAEKVLEHYLRVRHPQVARLNSMGMDMGDIEQELRIALWKAWSAWTGQIVLRRWLSWKMDYCLRDLERACAKQLRRFQVVSLEALLPPENTD